MICQSPLATGYHEELRWPRNKFIQKGRHKFQHVALHNRQKTGVNNR